MKGGRSFKTASRKPGALRNGICLSGNGWKQPRTYEQPKQGAGMCAGEHTWHEGQEGQTHGLFMLLAHVIIGVTGWCIAGE